MIDWMTEYWYIGVAVGLGLTGVGLIVLAFVT